MSGKSMAEVLEAHDDDQIKGGYWFCHCGYDYGVFGGFGEAKALHQQDMLTTAGFGDVQDAAAKALEDAENVIDDELQDAEPSNYEEDNYDAGYIAGLTYAQDELRARAAAVRGEG